MNLNATPQIARARITELRAHLVNLQASDRAAMAAGEWDRADFIGNCIDDTRDEIKQIERDLALAVINAAEAA